MPTNVRPEFMEAAEEFLRDSYPSMDWRDAATPLSVAVFGQKVFDGDIDVGSVVHLPAPGDEAARDWLIGRMEYVQLQGDILIEAKDGEGYVVTLKPDSAYDRETLGAFDTLTEAVESISTTEAEQIADHCKANNIKGHSINADGSCNMGCC